MGRNTIMTPDIINKLEEAFMMGCSDLEACLFADIGKSTLYNYQEINPDFVERKELLKKTPTFTARKTVIRDVATDSDLALKYLERKEKDEFSTKSDINNTHTFTRMERVKIGESGLEFHVGEDVK